MALKLGIQALRSYYMKLTCEYELHILPNTKISAPKDDGENYMKVRPTLDHHLLRNRLLNFFAAVIIREYSKYKLCI